MTMVEFRCPVRPWPKTMFLYSPVLKQYLSDSERRSTSQPEDRGQGAEGAGSPVAAPTYRWTETLRAPAGYALKKVPDPIRLDGDARPTSAPSPGRTGPSGSTASFTLKKRIFPVEMYANLKQVLDSVHEERKRVLVLEKVEVQ
jgi:hypothetical protein